MSDGSKKNQKKKSKKKPKKKNRPIKTGIKTFLFFISLSMLTTSFVGLMSVVEIVSEPNNFDIDSNNFSVSIGPLGNKLTFGLVINNTGYFDFEDFTVEMKLSLMNTTSKKHFTCLDKQLFQKDLAAQSKHNVTVKALEADFNVSALLNDMGGSWNDPEINQIMLAYSAINFSGVEALSLPYILWNYNLTITPKVSTSYNLGLIDVGIDLSMTYTYFDFFYETYPAMKQRIMAFYLP
jgi:hypothetical protein